MLNELHLINMRDKKSAYSKFQKIATAIKSLDKLILSYSCISQYVFAQCCMYLSYRQHPYFIEYFFKNYI